MNRIGRQLDETDRRLVALLRQDGRCSAAALARALNLSRTAVQARIARLEADKVILGYSATVAPGFADEVAALVSLTIGVRPCAQLTDRLAAWPEVRQVYSVAGRWDALLLVRVETLEALSSLADRLQAVQEIGTVETIVILSERPGVSPG